jgi:hypothetical protein
MGTLQPPLWVGGLLCGLVGHGDKIQTISVLVNRQNLLDSNIIFCYGWHKGNIVMKFVYYLLIMVVSILFSCAHQEPFNQYDEDLDPEASQEQEMEIMQKKDIDYLIQNATSLEDFEYHRYPFQKPTMASTIYKKYSDIRPDHRLYDDARRQWYVNRHQNLSGEIKQRILLSKSPYDHILTMGMTEEQVWAAIGFPDDINSITDSRGIFEQWVYGSGIHIIRYFYFSNGKLVIIQD